MSDIYNLARRLKGLALINAELLEEGIGTTDLRVHKVRQPLLFGSETLVPHGGVVKAYGPFGVGYWHPPDPNDPYDRMWTGDLLGQIPRGYGWYFDVDGELYEGEKPINIVELDPLNVWRLDLHQVTEEKARPILGEMLQFVEDTVSALKDEFDEEEQDDDEPDHSDW